MRLQAGQEELCGGPSLSPSQLKKILHMRLHHVGNLLLSQIIVRISIVRHVLE